MSYLKDKEHGGILPFVAINIFVILAMAVWLVDGSRSMASIEQAKHFARLAALASIEEYFDTSCQPANPLDPPLSDQACFNLRFATARAKAYTISSGNTLISHSGHTGQAVVDTATQNNFDTIIQAGTWGLDPSCPNTTPARPCFTPLASTAFSPNAIRIRGPYYLPLINRLSNNFFGRGTENVFVDAVATVVPRRGCFVIDLSPSMTRISHKKGEAEFGYRFSDNRYYNLRNPRGTDQSLTNHYQDDYVLKDIYGDEDYPSIANRDKFYNPTSPEGSQFSSGPRQQYRIDNFVDPVPLTTVFAGLNSAMRRFQERRIAGDKACIIFYDQNINWSRLVRLNDDWNFMVGLTDFTKSNPFTDDPAGITTSQMAADTQRARIIRHKLFPAAASFTDTMYAFSVAQNELARTPTNGVATADFLVHIGDGMVNCSNTCPVDPQTGVAPNRCCNNDYGFYSDGMDQLRSYLGSQAYIHQNIPVHWILMGQHVSPYTIDLAKNPADNNPTCYTDREFRADIKVDTDLYDFAEVPTYLQCNPNFGSCTSCNNCPDTCWCEFLRASANHPFYTSVQNTYQLARYSQGLFAPIRPQHDSDGDCACIKDSTYEGSSSIQSACNNTATCNSGNMRTVDPYCRSEEQQIQDYMDEVIGDNPYTLVEVNESLG